MRVLIDPIGPDVPAWIVATVGVLFVSAVALTLAHEWLVAQRQRREGKDEI